MIRLQILACIFGLIEARAQHQGDSVLGIQIMCDSVSARTTDPRVSVLVLSSNTGQRNLILYGFDSNLLTVGFTPEDLCASDEVGAGIGALIYTENHQRRYSSFGIPPEIAYTPLSKERFERSVKESRRKFLSGTKVLTKMDTSTSRVSIPLEKFYLTKGKYWIQIIYYSGKNVVTRVVGEDKALEDKILYDANIFEGCATSNKIKLVIY